MKQKKQDYDGCKSTLNKYHLHESQKLIQKPANKDINLSSLITTLNKKQSPEKSRMYSELETQRKKSDNFIVPKIIKEEILSADKLDNYNKSKYKNSFQIKNIDDNK